jgi:hypothetical protein
MFGEFIAASGGSMMNTVISLGIALAIFNAIIAMLLQAGRNIFSTGRDKVWTTTINDALTLTHERFHSPWVARRIRSVIAGQNSPPNLDSSAGRYIAKSVDSSPRCQM